MQKKRNRFNFWNVLLKSFQGFHTIVGFVNLRSVNTREVRQREKSKDCVHWKVDTAFIYSICLWNSLLQERSDVAFVIGKKVIPRLFCVKFDAIKAISIMATVFRIVTPCTLIPLYQIK
jgi:hypothetical protein